MKICVAQTRPVKGDIQRNIENHKKFIIQSASHGADIIIFPELSLTGYEPVLSKDLATTQDDTRFDEFQQIADTVHMTIGVGVPTKKNENVCISMVLFQPHRERLTYSKKYLHTDEEAFFISGQSFTGLLGDQANIALAICYELSVPEHAENAFLNGAQVYMASVAKYVSTIDNAINSLSDIANKYSMTTFMSNCVGESEGKLCAGRTSIWNNKGFLVGQLNGSDEGILIMDTNTQEIIEKTV